MGIRTPKRPTFPVNPFPVGRIVSGAEFCSREKELFEITSAVLGHQNLILLAPSGMGKSSLCAESERRLRLEQVGVATIPLADIADNKDALVEIVATRMYKGLLRWGEQFSTKLISLLARLRFRPEMTVNADGTASFTIRPMEAPVTDYDARFRELLTLPEHMAKEHHRPVVVIWDDFERLSVLDPQLVISFRSILERQSLASNIVVLTDNPVARKLILPGGSLAGFAPVIELKPIATPLFTSYIAAKFKKSGLKVDSAALTTLLKETEGIPSRTIEMCRELWDKAVFFGTSINSQMVQEGIEDSSNQNLELGA